MHYFFLEDHALIEGNEAELAGENINHAYRVLRLKAGDNIVIADGHGDARQAVITISEPERVQVRFGFEIPSAESPLQITLFQALAKGEKMDLVIRQAVELGVKRIVPLVTGRTIPRWKSGQEEKKLCRWRSIVRSASAQCRRSYLPQVENLHNFEDVLLRFIGYRVLVPWEDAKGVPILKELKQPCPDDQAVFLLVGPEGGFSSREIDDIVQAGARIVHLGPRIMRTETAAIAAISIIQAMWGDLSGKG